MLRYRAIGALLLGVAACATPGQVRRVQTQVEILDRNQQRTDSAHAVELARLQQQQREASDSIGMLVRQLNANVQQMNRDDAANFDNLRQQLYQVANLQNATQSTVQHLRSQVETAVTTAPPPAAPPAATAGTDTAQVATTAPAIPQPDVLLTQARQMMDQSSYSNARIALNTLLQTYPQSPLVPDAVYYMGYSFDPTEPDSARVYYDRVAKTYPDSPRAPTALFKLGELENRAHNTAAARRDWQMIVDRYKSSDEYTSAQDRLRENP
jgi:TolA-binding protein